MAKPPHRTMRPPLDPPGPHPGHRGLDGPESWSKAENTLVSSEGEDEEEEEEEGDEEASVGATEEAGTRRSAMVGMGRMRASVGGRSGLWEGAGRCLRRLRLWTCGAPIDARNWFFEQGEQIWKACL